VGLVGETLGSLNFSLLLQPPASDPKDKRHKCPECENYFKKRPLVSAHLQNEHGFSMEAAGQVVKRMLADSAKQAVSHISFNFRSGKL
jgi:uncharacterized C2H2 Zn-finger protein